MNANEVRVLNLIRKVGTSQASFKKWGVIKLLKWQPSAKQIQFPDRCPTCRRRDLFYISYRLPGDPVAELNRQGDLEESCGYYCPFCGFSNAGGRDVVKRRGLKTSNEG